MAPSGPATDSINDLSSILSASYLITKNKKRHTCPTQTANQDRVIP